MKGLILLTIAIVLGILFFPIGLLYTFTKTFLNVSQTFIKRLRAYFFIIALSIDQLGNVIMQEIFNDLLILPGGNRFGNPDETISSVLGKNKLKNTLTRSGIILCKFLDLIERNHVEKSIEQNETEIT